MAVSVNLGSKFRYEKPQPLFEKDYVNTVFEWLNFDFCTWDIHPVDKRFLMIKQSETTEQGPRKITVVVNWQEDLKEKVPVD